MFSPKRRRMENAAEVFRRDGVAVVQIYTKEELEIRSKGLQAALKGAPEFGEETLYNVMDAFGANGAPSTFHHPVVQYIRLDIHERFSKKVIPELADGYQYWHQLFDRVGVRSPSTGSVSSETWHYDTCEDNQIKDKKTFGGWINLSMLVSQWFYGIKGCMGPNYQEGTKYAALGKELHPEFEKKLKAQGGPIEVPPGHMVIFVPELVHKVMPGKVKNLSMRLYVGHVMFNSPTPLFGFDANKIEANELPRIPSGQLPPMWSPNHWRFHADKLIRWTAEMRPRYQYVEEVPRGDHTVARVKRYLMEPCEVYPYTEETKRIMLPMRV